jgi:serine/threonine protein kinase
MASLMTLCIQRQCYGGPSHVMRYAFSEADVDQPLLARIHAFLDSEALFLQAVCNTPGLHSFQELNIKQIDKDSNGFNNIKEILYKTHNLEILREQLPVFLGAWRFLKTCKEINELLKTSPQRFKIRGVGSMTLAEENAFFIHMKKAPYKVVIGASSKINAHRALCVSAHAISLVAELTQRDPHDLPPPSLSPSKYLLTAPLSAPVKYTSSSKTHSLYSVEKKCSLFPLYSTDFFSILSYHFSIYPILPVHIQWKMCVSVLHILNIIHSQGFVYRDVKLENLLISFNHLEGSRIDFNHCEIALCDFELMTENASVSKYAQWLGTDQYWPPHRIKYKERQQQPADVYGLGVIILSIFRKRDSLNKDRLSTRDNNFIDRVANLMTVSDPTQRPPLVEILNKFNTYLNTHHPDFPWLREFFPNIS